RIGMRGAGGIRLGAPIGDSHALHGDLVRLRRDGLVAVLDRRLAAVLGLGADVVGALLGQRLVRRQTAVARGRQRRVRATAAAREDRGAASGGDLLLVA